MLREGLSYKRAFLVLLGFGGTTCLIYYLYTKRKRDVPTRHAEPKKPKAPAEAIVQPTETKSEEVTPTADTEPSVERKEDVIVTDDRSTISGAPSNNTTDKPASTSESADSSFEQVVPQAPPSIDPSVSLESSSTFEKVSLPPSQIPDAAGEPGKSLEVSDYEQVSVSHVGAGEAAEEKPEFKPAADIEAPAATDIETKVDDSNQPVPETTDEHKSMSTGAESQRESGEEFQGRVDSSILEKDENDIVVIETEKHDTRTEEKPFELRIDEEPRQSVEDIPETEPVVEQIGSSDLETSQTEVEDIGPSQELSVPQSPPLSSQDDTEERTS